MTQLSFPTVEDDASRAPQRGLGPFRTQLLKWVGNKQRFAHEILGYLPSLYGTYYEPFIGSGAVLGTLAPNKAVASDVLGPLIEIWKAVASDPSIVEDWYKTRWERAEAEGKAVAYESIKAAYNASPNGADLLFLSRSCYGGVVRFRQRDGGISTPCGAHRPISPESFARRAALWHVRVRHTEFLVEDFETAMGRAASGDVIYCDPPYSHTQSILYGAQRFELSRLLDTIARCKSRGVHVILSIDGTKRSGSLLCNVPIPDGLFEREAAVNCGRSMLRRFQMKGETLEGEQVHDRLLLTY